METVLLVILVIIALALIAVVLVQRSEGGALGMGGGPGGLFSARGSANLLTRITAGLAAAFMILSLVLVIIEGSGSRNRSVMDAPLATDVATPPTADDAAIDTDPADTGERVPVGATEGGAGETFTPGEASAQKPAGESGAPKPENQESTIPQSE